MAVPNHLEFNLILVLLQAFRMDPFTANNSASAADQIKKGVIPNKARAEEIATRQFNAAKKVRIE